MTSHALQMERMSFIYRNTSYQLKYILSSMLNGLIIDSSIMPPAKRIRRTKATASTPTPPPAPVSAPASPENHDEANEEIVSNASSAPTFDSIEPVDAALIDEEEVPDAEENEDVKSTKAVSGDKQRRTYGGGYNALKTFNGQVYSGMAIGGSHTWNYDQGVWKETKEEPDLWKIDYKTTKRRARNAPKGSGAPVGTAYHWYIVAHQVRLLYLTFFYFCMEEWTSSLTALLVRSMSKRSTPIPTRRISLDRNTSSHIRMHLPIRGQSQL